MKLVRSYATPRYTVHLYCAHFGSVQGPPPLPGLLTPLCCSRAGVVGAGGAATSAACGSSSTGVMVLRLRNGCTRLLLQLLLLPRGTRPLACGHAQRVSSACEHMTWPPGHVQARVIRCLRSLQHCRALPAKLWLSPPRAPRCFLPAAAARARMAATGWVPTLCGNLLQGAPRAGVWGGGWWCE
jgi:hypothetical protein